jgi:hypothetical protein
VVEGAGDLGGDGERGGDGARDAALGGAVDGLEGAHAEAELAGVDAAVAEAGAHVAGEEGELVGPHAGGDAEEEDAVPEGHGAGAVGDAGADGVAPHLERDGGPGAREAALAGAVEDGLHGLGGDEPLAGASLHWGDL